MTYPTILPKLTLDFANSRQLDPRITFSRSSSATYLHPDTGLITTAPSDVARFEEQGLLIEEARTNLLLHSEEFDDAVWTKTDVTVTPNVITAPDGSLTADKLVENTSNAYHLVRQTLAGITPSAIYSYSIFAKAGERSTIQLTLGQSTAWGVGASAIFDLATGTILDIGSNAVSANIQALADGWYRCELVGQRTATVTGSFHYVYLVDDSGNLLYTGDGTSGVYLWGGQLELGNFSTSYIPTAGATATRAADVASMTGTNFSSWYNQGEGTMLCDYRVPSAKNNSLVWGLNGATDADRITHYLRASSGGDLRFDVQAGGAYTSINTLPNPRPDIYRTAVGIAPQNIKSVLNGGALFEDTGRSGDVPTVTQFFIGTTTVAATYNGLGHISRIAYYPVRLPDEQLQALTA